MTDKLHNLSISNVNYVNWSIVDWFSIIYWLIIIYIIEFSFHKTYWLFINNSSTDNKIHLYVMSTMNFLILFCVWIKVRRVKRFQFNAVWTMLECCVIRKIIMQSFHSCDNIFSNSHNQSMKKINDMSMSVRDKKILLVKKTIQMKSLRIVITSDWRICNSLTALISKRLHHIDNVIK